MLLSQKYRLYPSKQQEAELEKHLELCRQVYNHFLEQLNEADEIPSEYEAKNQLPNLKKEWPEIKQVHSKVLQTTVEQLYSNLKSLSEKKKNGYRVGKLRFKGRGWFKTFRYNQSGFQIKEQESSIRRDTFWLSKIGEIPIRLHRPVTGEVKGVILKRTSSGKWFAILQVEENLDPEPVKGERKAAYVENYDVIVVEDLDVTDMVEDSKYAKSNLDASWGTFTEMLTYKAEKAGTETEVVKVDPENTTKDCAECGTEVPKPLWQREHTCPECGWGADRDYNAALNILKRGIEKLDLGKGQPETTPVDTEPLPEEGLHRIPASSVVETGSSVLTEAHQGLKVRAG